MIDRRILFVDQTAQLGGAELWLKDVVLARGGTDSVYLFQAGPLSEQLTQQGVEVTTYQASDRLATLRKDSGILIKLRGSWDVLRLVQGVARAARQVDLLYANTPKALVVSALAGIVARRPVIYHLHDILSRDHFSRSNLALLVGLSNRLVRHVVANSQATLRAYRQAGGKCSASVSYNGFDPGQFAPYIQNRQEHRVNVRSELQLEPTTPVAALFGRLAPWKGQHVAIAALDHLPNHHLMLVGDALFGEAAYKQQLADLAQQPSVKGRVHFLGFRREVLSLMQASDYILHASIAPEPFGRVIVEAMLSQRPIIAAAAGGAAEIVEDQVTGHLVTPGDPRALAAAMQRVDELGPNKLTAMLARAAESAAERFSLTAAVEHVRQVAQSHCARQASHGPGH